MTSFIQVRPNGKIEMQGECPPEQLEHQHVEGCTLVKESGSIDRDYYDWKTQSLKRIPDAPSQFHSFDFEKKKWMFNKDAALPQIRKERDRLLKESDWIFLQDVPIDEQARQEWIAYRQKLRDVPQIVDNRGVDWPTPPRK